MKSSFNRLIAVGLLLAIAAMTAIAWISSYHGWWLPLELLSHFQVQYFSLSLLLLLRCVSPDGDRSSCVDYFAA